MALRVRVYRYFFYEWLFRDADMGSMFERSAAIRHNREQARWLPTYLFRWLVTGTVLIMLQQLSESVSGDSVVSALLAVMVIFVLIFHLITGILWAFLQVGVANRQGIARRKPPVAVIDIVYFILRAAPRLAAALKLRYRLTHG